CSSVNWPCSGSSVGPGGGAAGRASIETGFAGGGAARSLEHAHAKSAARRRARTGASIAPMAAARKPAARADGLGRMRPRPVKPPPRASHMKPLRAAALAYPGAVEEFPWGDRVFKVRKKIFVFINVHEGKLYVTAKLPASGKMALLLPFASPTGYNLGKSGWV